MSELNDPRVLFAAERTLLAWSRTSLTLMGFGFLIERFGLFLQMLESSPAHHRGLSFWFGVVFIVLAVVVAVLANLQYRRVLAVLKPAEIPSGYSVRLGMMTNLALAALGIALATYLIYGFV